MRVEGSQLGSYKADEKTAQVMDYNKHLAAANVKPEEKVESELPNSKNKEISLEELEKKIKQLNKAAEAMERRFQFSMHKETHRVMVKVFRKDNGELIAEIPPKRILDVLAQIDKEMGLLVDKKA